jgi:hypothetical protein
MKNFIGWKYYTDKYSNYENVGIVSPDGRESRSLQDIEVAKWLEEGNTPEPADIPEPADE